MLRTGIGRSARGFNTFALQKRYTSSQQGPVTIYTGPMANVAKKLKLFSITSLGLGVGISPFVFVIDVPVPFVAKAALVGAGKKKKEKELIKKVLTFFFFLKLLLLALLLQDLFNGSCHPM